MRKLIAAVCLSAFLPLSAAGQTCGFYNVAHMANSTCLIDWAIAQGANAIEIDLDLRKDGNFDRFYHEGITDCFMGLSGGICKADKCPKNASVKDMVRHVASKQMGVALVILDAKAGNVKSDKLEYSGDRIAVEVLQDLYKNGYNGNVILGVPRLSHVPLLKAAFNNIHDHAPDLLSKIVFSVDQEGDNAKEVLAALSGFSPSIYGTGITANLHSHYQDAIDYARSHGALFTYIWTIDKGRVLDDYLDHGVSAIVTNVPAELKKIIDKRGLHTAERGDGLICR